MNLFQNVADGVTKAIDYVVEANRKAALINRVKVVVRSEEKNIDQAYIALGKYYFRNLRDESNEETEHYCKAVENGKSRLDRALTKLEELTTPDDRTYGDGEGCEDCNSDCDECPYYEDFDSEADLRDLEKLDGFEPEEEPEMPEAESHPDFLKNNVVYESVEETMEEAADENEEDQALPFRD